MPLVDYSSSSDDDDNPAFPPSKKRRTRTTTGSPPPRPFTKPPRSAAPASGFGSGAAVLLPPLPPAFHDLYASTVRTTTRDDPSLHQGRTRQNPHVAGNWPSHVYVEWHPPPAVHALLAGLVSALQDSITTNTTNTTNNSNGTKINSLLVSDLGAPLPLHISLSRPLALASDAKDAFLREVQNSAVRGSGVAPFWLTCTGAEWHRTGESGRSFLVLRVRSSSGSGSSTSASGERDDDTDRNPNPELTELLRRCNSVAARYGQPGLYQWAGREDDDGAGGREVGEAFHLSIAWSFAEPGEELQRATRQVFGEPAAMKRLREVQVPVDGVKVKIGNVITHVELRRPGTSRKVARNLLGF